MRRDRTTALSLAAALCLSASAPSCLLISDFDGLTGAKEAAATSGGVGGSAPSSSSSEMPNPTAGGGEAGGCGGAGGACGTGAGSGGAGGEGTGECAPTPNNLLEAHNGDFELGCAGWATYGEPTFPVLNESTDARCGSNACQVCATQGITSFAVSSDYSFEVASGDRYLLTFFVKQVPSTPSVQGEAAIETWNQSKHGGPVVPGADWQKVSVLFDSKEADTIDFLGFYADSAPASGCVLIDDAVLSKLD